MPIRKDLTGSKFGKLTVLKEYHKRNGNRNRIFQHCICDCGKYTDVIKGSGIVSCGCAKIRNSDRHQSKLREHWGSMIKRCNEGPGKPHYKWYMAKGITVCEEWQNFIGFYNDMRSLWQQGLELDRIDNDKGYCKSNCRWVTKAEQQRNRSSVKLSIEDIESIKIIDNMEQKEIAKLFNVSQSHISRIRNGKQSRRNHKNKTQF